MDFRDLLFYFLHSGNTILLTMTCDGKYRITAKGAMGGKSSNSSTGHGYALFYNCFVKSDGS